MATEPELKDAGNTPPFPQDQLKTFIEKLGPPENPKITIPGFLFRDERSRSFKPIGCHYYRDPFFEHGSFDKQLANIDNNLILEHVETYRRGLEARAQLLARIKPVEILAMVRDVWGKGEIVEKELGATLTYPYLSVDEETYYSSRTVEHSHYMTGISYSTVESSGKTGKWVARPTSVSELIHVDFGNIAHHSLPFFSDDLYHGSFSGSDGEYHGLLDEFFADSYNGVKRLPIGDEYFREIPKTIWRRPDNLVIVVTAPRASLVSEEGWKPENWYRRVLSCYAWFDQSASQQEIMDFIAQKLDAQRIAGFLPSQLEALEVAKIEELRKRRLFVELGK